MNLTVQTASNGSTFAAFIVPESLSFFSSQIIHLVELSPLTIRITKPPSLRGETITNNVIHITSNINPHEFLNNTIESWMDISLNQSIQIGDIVASLPVNNSHLQSYFANLWDEIDQVDL